MHEKGTGVSRHEQEALPNAENARATGPRSPKLAVLVAGMHRSGTSALTRTLHLLGCDLPKSLMPANFNNELGHWESLAIMKLNDELLAAAGSAWDDWKAFNQPWYASPAADMFRKRARTTLDSEFGSSQLFGGQGKGTFYFLAGHR